MSKSSLVFKKGHFVQDYPTSAANVVFISSSGSHINYVTESSFNMTRGGGDEDIETRRLKF